MRTKAYGCKMLDTLPIDTMNRKEIIEYLEVSCCPALKEFSKQL